MHCHFRTFAASACLLGSAAVAKLQATQAEKAQADQARILTGLRQAEQAAAVRVASAASAGE